MSPSYHLHSSQTFQLTTSRGGRPPNFISMYSPQYFNSRPHEEVDRSWRDLDFAKGISTHDLTRRSTPHISEPVLNVQISTHDLTRRSTPIHGTCNRSCIISTHDLTRRSTAIFTQKVFLSKSLFVLIAYNIFILH